MTLRDDNCGFTLIELIIALVILGVLVTLILPSFNDTVKDSRGDALMAEMRSIQTAYTRYYRDNFPSTEPGGTLEAISYYGLYPLCTDDTTEITEDGFQDPISLTGVALATDAFRGLDRANDIGWNGPYLTNESRLVIQADQPGQPVDANLDPPEVRVPVINDPYGHYYRVVVPRDGDGIAYPKRITLISTGPNGILETTENDVFRQGSLIPGDERPFSGVLDADYNDDFWIPLLPFEVN